jgi:hypothetical protein
MITILNRLELHNIKEQMDEGRLTMITILNRLELHNIKEQMDEGRPTLPTSSTARRCPQPLYSQLWDSSPWWSGSVVPSVWTGTPGAAAMQRTLDVESRGRTWS